MAARKAEDDSLSDREREVLRLPALGPTNHEIAKELYISVRTAETHRAHIMQKLGGGYYQRTLRSAFVQAREVIDEALAAAEALDVDAEGEIMEGDAVRQIVDLARARDVDLLVVGSRALGSFASTLLGSVSCAVVHDSDRPVLVVTAPPNRRRAAADRGPLGAAASAAASRGVRAATELVAGDPADEIVAYADCVDADPIVVGTRGHARSPAPSPAASRSAFSATRASPCSSCRGCGKPAPPTREFPPRGPFAHGCRRADADADSTQ